MLGPLLILTFQHHLHLGVGGHFQRLGQKERRRLSFARSAGDGPAAFADFLVAGAGRQHVGHGPAVLLEGRAGVGEFQRRAGGAVGVQQAGTEASQDEIAAVDSAGAAIGQTIVGQQSEHEGAAGSRRRRALDRQFGLIGSGAFQSDASVVADGIFAFAALNCGLRQRNERGERLDLG
jgi:hypothetical protein